MQNVKTIAFPNTVPFPDSYLNDVRFDLNLRLTTSGQGVAYITDSSSEGRTGLIVVDLGTGQSWRHLDGSPHVAPGRQSLEYVWGRAVYANQSGNAGFLGFGVDGIALGADGQDLFSGGVGNRYMYSIPTARLRENGPLSDIQAQAAVVSRTQKGLSDGFETDTNGFVYHGNLEINAIAFFNPSNGTDQVLVRDPRIKWSDTVSMMICFKCVLLPMSLLVFCRHKRIPMAHCVPRDRRESSTLWALQSKAYNWRN